MTPQRKIIVFVKGGVVQHVDNPHKNITVEVRDYDVDGSNDPDIHINEDGEYYVVTGEY